MESSLHVQWRSRPILAAVLAPLAAIGLGSCSAAHAAGAPWTTLRSAATTSVATTTSRPSSTTINPSSGAGGSPSAAWVASINAFYRASSAGTSDLTALDATLLPGSAELNQENGFISSQELSGVVGPSTWRIGNVHVDWISGALAEVSACSFDPGSHYKSSGKQAPVSLGGGAGLTAYVAHLRLEAGKWLLYATQVSVPSSTTAAGPCHAF